METQQSWTEAWATLTRILNAQHTDPLAAAQELETSTVLTDLQQMLQSRQIPRPCRDVGYQLLGCLTLKVMTEKASALKRLAEASSESSASKRLRVGQSSNEEPVLDDLSVEVVSFSQEDASSSLEDEQQPAELPDQTKLCVEEFLILRSQTPSGWALVRVVQQKTRRVLFFFEEENGLYVRSPRCVVILRDVDVLDSTIVRRVDMQTGDKYAWRMRSSVLAQIERGLPTGTARTAEQPLIVAAHGSERGQRVVWYYLAYGKELRDRTTNAAPQYPCLVALDKRNVERYVPYDSELYENLREDNQLEDEVAIVECAGRYYCLSGMFLEPSNGYFVRSATHHLGTLLYLSNLVRRFGVEYEATVGGFSISEKQLMADKKELKLIVRVTEQLGKNVDLAPGQRVKIAHGKELRVGAVSYHTLMVQYFERVSGGYKLDPTWMSVDRHSRVSDHNIDMVLQPNGLWKHVKEQVEPLIIGGFVTVRSAAGKRYARVVGRWLCVTYDDDKVGFCKCDEVVCN